MTWDYRIVRHDDGMLGVHEVYYKDDRVWGCTEKTVGPLGDNLEELLDELQRMVDCIDLPILDYDSIGRE